MLGVPLNCEFAEFTDGVLGPVVTHQFLTFPVTRQIPLISTITVADRVSGKSFTSGSLV